jgi:hypothetical protein
VIACGSSCSRRAATAGGYTGLGYTYADIATARFVRDHRVCGVDAFDVPADVLRQAPGAVAVVAAGLAMAARTRR